jgi:hypothetical protein
MTSTLGCVEKAWQMFRLKAAKFCSQYLWASPASVGEARAMETSAPLQRCQLSLDEAIHSLNA